MKATLKRFTPGKKAALTWSVIALVLAIAGTIAKGHFNPLPVLCVALPVFAIVSEQSKLWKLALWSTGLIVGSGLLIGTIGTYGEFVSGQALGSSLLVAAVILLLALPTFLHLYFNSPDIGSANGNRPSA